MTYNIFNFEKNQWLYYYLNRHVIKNPNIRSLSQVKELSINILEKVFRKKGFFTKHKREHWIICAEQKKCSDNCRNSNGFKTDIDILYKKSKCVPKTRKINPNFKGKDGFKKNSSVQYAYAFLQNYNSILYTLKNYKIKDKKTDAILRQLITKEKINRSIKKLTTAYENLQNKQFIKLSKKIEKLKKSTNQNTKKRYKSSRLPYESEVNKKLKLINNKKTRKNVDTNSSEFSY